MASKIKAPPRKRGKPKGVKDKSPKQAAKEIERLENMNVALELRKKAWHYRKIAAEMSRPKGEGHGIGRPVSPSTVSDWVQAAMKMIPVENAEIVKQMHLDRLDELMRLTWREVEECDEAGKGLSRDAFGRVLRIMDRQAQYMGLYAPEGGGSGANRIADALSDPESYAKIVAASAPTINPDGPMPDNPIL